MGQHAADQGPVGGGQRHGDAALLDVAQYAGGCTVGFVFGVCRRVQGHLRWGLCRGRLRIPQRHTAGAGTPVLHQGEVEGVGLKPLQHHQRIHGSSHTGLKQHIGGVARGQHPFQCQAGYQGFIVQGTAFVGGGQQGTGLIAPSGAALGLHSSHHRGQLGCSLLQRGGQHITQSALPHTLEQRPCRQGVTRHVARKVITRGLRALQLPGPVARGFKTRGKPLRKLLRPETLGPRHQLGVGHQHHGARQMRALGLRMGRHLGQSAVPYSSARSGVPITFRYDSHSIARPGHTGERGIGFCHNA